tara:strand:- start:879 stop:1355 length:477 start_codon:yes stop_codon:yes gene_type:complete
MIFKFINHMTKKILFLTIFLLLTTSCQKKEVIKTHGISYLEHRQKLISINKSNKNDVIKVFGQPATKGMVDNNLWIYIERTTTRSSLFKLGKSYIKKNNVLALEFNKYGVLIDKKFYDKNNMKKIEFSKDITENEIRKENFIYSFLSSVRQKMQQSKK